MVNFYLLQLFVLYFPIVFSKETKNPSPIILVPGDGGSRVYQEFDFHYFKYQDLVWVNYIYMFFPSLFTWRIKLIYDPKSHKTRNRDGVKLIFPGWGSTEMIEELDDFKHSATSYFHALVEALTQDSYYIRNKTIRGTPFDFRKAPNENIEFHDKFQILIEETYNLTGNQRVVILGHSLGSLYTLYFLKKMPISWKKKYIRAFLSVNGPLAGSMKAVKSETIGVSVGSPARSICFRDMERSFPSTAFLMIKPEIFEKKPIVITSTKNYSAYDYEDLFKDMSMPYGFMMYEDSKNIVNGSETPEGIDEIYCIHSNGFDTPEQLIIKSFSDGKAKIKYGDGDSTVNIKSLEICKQWKNVRYYVIEKADHMKIVKNPEFINIVKTILYRN